MRRYTSTPISAGGKSTDIFCLARPVFHQFSWGRCQSVFLGAAFRASFLNRAGRRELVGFARVWRQVVSELSQILSRSNGEIQVAFHVIQ